ncbi:MAG: hypothetical protein AB7G39_15165 [Alphaproteobacteria bacterium]
MSDAARGFIVLGVLLAGGGTILWLAWQWVRLFRLRRRVRRLVTVPAAATGGFIAYRAGGDERFLRQITPLDKPRDRIEATAMPPGIEAIWVDPRDPDFAVLAPCIPELNARFAILGLRAMLLVAVIHVIGYLLAD